jgi:hypothetical protein
MLLGQLVDLDVDPLRAMLHMRWLLGGWLAGLALHGGLLLLLAAWALGCRGSCGSRCGARGRNRGGGRRRRSWLWQRRRGLCCECAEHLLQGRYPSLEAELDADQLLLHLSADLLLHLAANLLAELLHLGHVAVEQRLAPRLAGGVREAPDVGGLGVVG